MSRGHTRRPPRDPFRVLAIASILLGMTIIIASMLVWYFTGRQSQLIVGTGLALTIGGGLRELLASIIRNFPTYVPPPPQIPPPDSQPKSKGSGRK